MKLSEQSGFVKRLITCGGIAGAITAIFTLIITLCGFAWNFAGAFMQSPPTPIPTPTYVMMEGRLSDVALEYGIDFGEYLDMTGGDKESYSDDHLHYPGVLANYKVRISGFMGQPCTLRWSVYSADSQEWLYSSTFDLYDQTITVERVLTPERDVDQASDMVWIATPAASGQYYARLELYDPKGIRLDYIDSATFEVP